MFIELVENQTRICASLRLRMKFKSFISAVCSIAVADRGVDFQPEPSRGIN